MPLGFANDSHFVKGVAKMGPIDNLNEEGERYGVRKIYVLLVVRA